MLNEIIGDYPQIKVIEYLLMNPFAELNKLQIAVGAEISRKTLNEFIEDMISEELIEKTSNSKYKLNLQSPIVIKLNMLLDELNRIGIQNAMNEMDEPYDDLSQKELNEIFDENSPDVDLIKLENKILMKEIFYNTQSENYCSDL